MSFTQWPHALLLIAYQTGEVGPSRIKWCVERPAKLSPEPKAHKNPKLPVFQNQLAKHSSLGEQSPTPPPPPALLLASCQQSARERLAFDSQAGAAAAALAAEGLDAGAAAGCAGAMVVAMVKAPN